MPKLRSQPRSGGGMSDVVTIEKRDQNIDVEQRSHSVRVLFPQSIDLLVRNQSSPAFKRYEAADSGMSRLGGNAGECAAGEIRQYGSRRPV